MSDFKGHCQACLRKQAVNDRTGRLAKHGYKVAGYGYFHGTCNGSGELPLEKETTILDREVKLLNQEANRLDKLVAKGPSVVKKVPVERQSQTNRYKIETVYMTRDEFIEYKTLTKAFRPEEHWDRATEFVIKRTAKEAAYLREFAADLEKNRDKIHGQDLIDVRAIEAAKPEYEDRKKIFKFQPTSTDRRDPARMEAYREAREFLSGLYDNPNAKTKNVRRNSGYLQIEGPFKITRNGEWDDKTYGFRITWQQLKGTE